VDDVRCQEVVEVLTDYLEGGLATDERELLEQHLLLCAGCGEYLEQLRTTIALTGRLTEEDVPDQLVDTVLRRFRER
jgi:hypothetical protein